MPLSAPRPCRTPGCAGLVRVGGYCRSCKKHRNRRRPSPAKRGYDQAWRQLRLQHLEEHPHCARCGKRAVVVDHKTPIRKGGARLDPNNLQSLCRGCHGRKTILEDS